MSDSTFYFSFDISHLQDSTVSDSVTSVTLIDSTGFIMDSFFGTTTQYLPPIPNHSYEYSGFIYLLLFLSFGVALIWYLIPERISYAFSISVKPDSTKLNEKESPAPGTVVTFFFLINSLITISFLIYYIFKNMYGYDFVAWGLWKSMFFIGTIISTVYILKVILIRISGWVFHTIEMARKQARMYFNSNISLGVILLPLLFVLVIVPNVFVLYVILFIVAIVFLIRWIQVIQLGISITHFSFFHLILYLCTLEIIPVVVLVKIFI